MGAPSTKPAAGLLTGESIPVSLIKSTLAKQPSPNTRRSYAKGIALLKAFAGSQPITLALLQEWRIGMAGTLSTATVNSRVTGVRALIKEARRKKLIDAGHAEDLLELDGLPFRGARVGNWITQRQTDQLLAVPYGKSLRALRNRCVLSILAGCALRVGELTALDVETIQQRDGRWLLADLPGKGGRVRSVAIPAGVKQSIDAWRKASGINDGRLIRQLTLAPSGISVKTIQNIVGKAAAAIGVANFGPHDLRRSCARQCWEASHDLVAIQGMLGHANIETTRRYLGTFQDLRNAVNDKIGR